MSPPRSGELRRGGGLTAIVSVAAAAGGHHGVGLSLHGCWIARRRGQFRRGVQTVVEGVVERRRSGPDGRLGLGGQARFRSRTFRQIGREDLEIGIDGLAGGLGFMSLVTLGIFLTISKDLNYAMIAFALAGALLGFLYFNFNPARIFMGDTGSLMLGFVIAVLCVQLMKVNAIHPTPVVPNIYVFTLGIVMIPVFDTLRVFGTRIWKGRSPFSADKTHIHHLITNKGFTHAFAARIICVFHGFILILVYWMKNWKPELQVVALFCCMLAIVYLFSRIGILKKYFNPTASIPAPQTQPE